ncbi:MAG: D-alanyl-D-alanine carboxypeptidase [Microscillaceae bacterium]|nr:D-alanyl-D-alanine carboxypeptidase [Microscillaceae bacterium]
MAGCQASYVKSPRQLRQLLQNHPSFRHSFHGLCLYDLDKKSYIFDYQADKYFTPASNTKLFTFWAGLKLLPAQIPALWYARRADSLIFWGTGSPLLLNPDLRDTLAYQFLKNSPEKLFYSPANFRDQHLGYGWTWDAYSYYYSTEKSDLPIYANNVIIQSSPTLPLVVNPPIFKDSIQQKNNEKPQLWEATRHLSHNQIALQKHEQDTVWASVPMRVSPALTQKLLTDTLKKPVGLVAKPLTKDAQMLYTLATDSLYKTMLQVSDNFMAEQILLMAHNYLPDSLRKQGMNVQNTIDFITQKYFAQFPQKIQWLDGSGLSRANLFTPRQIIELLLMIYREVAPHPTGEKRLFSLLAIGGKAGTIKNLYKNDPPFIFAKTGTLSNNHNLSGYIVTKSGKRLVFSFMHNHFMTEIAEIRQAMEKILTEFYLKY